MTVDSKKEAEVMIDAVCDYIRSCNWSDHFTEELHTVDLAKDSANKLLEASNAKDFNYSRE